MKKIICSLAIILATTGYASPDSCRKQLTNGFEISSQSFSINTDLIDEEIDQNDKLGQSFQIIRAVLHNLGCSKNDVNFAKSSNGSAKSKCSLLQPNRLNSLGCYVETNLGYFFIHWDMGQTANVTFNNWD